jgi:hypothetical protein
MEKSLTKGFKEEVRSLVPSSEDPIQRKKQPQALAPDDYFEFDEQGALVAP